MLISNTVTSGDSLLTTKSSSPSNAIPLIQPDDGIEAIFVGFLVYETWYKLDVLFMENKKKLIIHQISETSRRNKKCNSFFERDERIKL